MTAKSTKSSRKDVYEKVTEQIIKDLELGKIPWERPWISAYSGDYAYRNNGVPYMGVNQLLLEPGVYGSYNQWLACGGQVKKGEKSHIAVYAKKITKKSKSDQQDEEDDDKAKAFFCYKTYPVFHISQVDFPNGRPDKFDKYVKDDAPTFNHTPDEKIQSIINTYIENQKIGLQIKDDNMNCYIPSLDELDLQPMETYPNLNQYYSTVFHELGHSTGHQTRLNRDLTGSMKTSSYAKEELIAEMTSGFFMNILGIDEFRTQENRQAYINSWISRLKQDPKLILAAAKKAENAVEFILDTLPEDLKPEKINPCVESIQETMENVQ